LVGKTLGGTVVESSMHLAELVLDGAQIAVVPGEPFGAPDHLRFSFALADDDLTRGMKRFAEFVAG
jgi:aspartate/methionine/tyrosine aminotransferase